MAWDRDISIFAKEASFRPTRTLPHPHLIRGSSLIRGNQMAEYLGCRLNPDSGWEKDVCIYVKPPGLSGIRDGAWVDVMDSDHRVVVRWLRQRPAVNVITFSDMTHRQYLASVTNRLALIPQHHCNFDREVRARKDVSVAGFIGGEIGFCHSFDKMKETLSGLGMDFLVRCRYRTREEVLDFYRRIDVQVVWSHNEYRLQPKAPLKVVNAASFGIPTVALPPRCYEEAEGHYIKVGTVDELVWEMYKLKDRDYYNGWSKKLTSWAEKYHIGRIADMYRGLS